MLSTYLGQLSDARHLIEGLDVNIVSPIIKVNALLYGNLYLSASDILSNPNIFLLMEKNDPASFSALLSSTDSPLDHQLLHPVMTEKSSFTELAEKFLRNDTITSKKEQLLAGAKRIDALRPIITVARNETRRQYYSCLLESTQILCVSGGFQQFHAPALALAEWLENLSDAERNDFRQSNVWRFIDTLKLGPQYTNDLRLFSDNHYQSAFAHAVGASLSFPLRNGLSITNTIGFARRRAQPARSRRPLAAPDNIEELGSHFPANAIASLSYIQIAALAATEPFINLRDEISAFHRGRDPSGEKFRRLFDDCTEPLAELIKNERVGKRPQIIFDWQAKRTTSRHKTILSAITIFSGVAGPTLAMTSGAIQWFIGGAAAAITAGKLLIDLKEQAPQVKSKTSIAVALAYNAILDEGSDPKRVPTKARSLN